MEDIETFLRPLQNDAYIQGLLVTCSNNPNRYLYRFLPIYSLYNSTARLSLPSGGVVRFPSVDVGRIDLGALVEEQYMAVIEPPHRRSSSLPRALPAGT